MKWLHNYFHQIYCVLVWNSTYLYHEYLKSIMHVHKGANIDQINHTLMSRHNSNTDYSKNLAD